MIARSGRVVAICFCVLSACSGAGATNDRSPTPTPAPSIEGVLVDKRLLVPEAFASAFRDGTPAAIAAAFDREPVFLAQATVIDGAFSMSRLGMRWQTDARRVRWKLTESRLEAWLVDDGTGIALGNDSERAIAAFAVSEHLDLRDGVRADEHGAPTGTPLATSRPWFARTFVRVDFSRNLVERVALSPDDERPWMPMSFASGPAAITFEWDPERRATRSFFVDLPTTLDVAQPRAGGFGQPDDSLCTLTALRPWECAPTRARLRWSFVPAARESLVPASPMSIQQQEMIAVRSIESRARGEREESVGITVAPRMWVDPWSRQVDRARVRSADNGAAIAAIGESGSTTTWATRPFRDRSSAPIALYVVGADPDEHSIAQIAASRFDATMNALLAEARRRECVLDDSPARGDCDRWTRDASTHERVIVVCHSPVWGSDPTLPGFHAEDALATARAQGWDAAPCGPQGSTAELGDGRHHVLAFDTSDDRRVGPALLVGGSVDRSTHEIIAAQLVVRRAELAIAAQSAVSLLRVANGEVTGEDVRRGADVGQRYPGEEFGGAGRDPYRGPDLGSNLADIRETPLEAALLTREQRAIALLDPRASGLSPTTRAVASPAGLFNVARFDAERRAHNHRAGIQCELSAINEIDASANAPSAWLAAFKDNRAPGGDALGGALEFLAPDRTINWVEALRWVHRAERYRVIAHAIGHLLGLAHNLAGSADTTNYRDAWWLGRTATGRAPRRALALRGEAPYSQLERDSGDLQGASIMDLDPMVPLGVGRADRAALAWMHFNMVEAFRRVAVRDRALSLAEHLATDAHYSLLGAGTNASLLLDAEHYTRVYEAIGTRVATTADGTPVRVPDLGDDNRFWVFTNETRRTAYNGFGFESALPNDATRGPNGEPTSALIVPYRVRRDWVRGEVWDALADQAAAEPYDVVFGKHARVGALFWWDVSQHRRPSRTLSEYVHLARRGEFESLRSITRLARRERELRATFSGVRNFDAWRASDETASVFDAPYDAVDRIVRDLSTPSSFWSGGNFTLATRPEDGARYYRAAAFGESGAFELPSGVGAPTLESRFILRPDGSISVESVGAHHLRVLFTLLLADVGAPSEQSSVEFLPPSLESSREGSLRWLASTLSEDWEDVGLPVLNPGRNLTLGARSLRALPSSAPSTHTAIQPDLPLDLRRWIAVAFVRGAGSSEHRFNEWSRVAREGEPDAPPPDRRVSFRDPLSGTTWLAEHVDATTLAPSADPGASPLEIRRALARCPAAESDCASWAARHAERSIAARLLLRGQSLADYLARATDSAEIARVTSSLRDVVSMIHALRQLTGATR
ncbi:MAG: hypothetical protein JNK05_04090 [Myxococcales bacterium]|nr:hypothetical protein [Myxococcales bacterium]